MRFLIFLLPLIKSEYLHVNILYEKLVDPEMEQLYKDIVYSIIERYNALISPLDIQIKVDDVLSYGVYREDNEYKELMKYSGSEDLKSRMSVLSNLNKNILLISSVPNDINEDIIYEKNIPCRTKYVTSFSFIKDVDVDTVSGINNSIRRWISKLFGSEVPNPFGNFNLEKTRRFLDDIRHNKFIDKLKSCTRKSDILLNEKNGIEFDDQIRKLTDDIPDLDKSEIDKKFEDEKPFNKIDEQMYNQLAVDIAKKIKEENLKHKKSPVKHKGKVVNLVNSFGKRKNKQKSYKIRN